MKTGFLCYVFFPIDVMSSSAVMWGRLASGNQVKCLLLVTGERIQKLKSKDWSGCSGFVALSPSNPIPLVRAHVVD
jgi:hypothetical protein